MRSTLFCCLFTVFGPLFAAEPLTLQACLGIALDTSPLNRAAQEGICIAGDQVGEANASYYPVVSAIAHYNRFQCHAFLPTSPVFDTVPTVVGPTNDWQFGVNGRYVLYDSGRRQSQLESALAIQSQAEEQAQQTFQSVALQVSTAFYTLAGQLELHEVAELLLHQAENHLQLAQDRKEVGDIPKSDVLRVETEVSEARQVLVRAEGDVLISMGNLNIAMGLPPDTPLTLSKTKHELEEPDQEALCEAMETAIDQRPELAAANARLRALHAKIDTARSHLGPRVNADALYSHRDVMFPPHDAEWLVGVSLEWPLVLGTNSQYVVNEARSEWSKAKSDYDQLELQVRQQVWQAFANLKTAYQNTRTAQKQLSSARETLRLIEERYKVNSATTSDLLDAQSALARTEASAIQAHWSYALSRTVFLWSQGLLCPEG